jgi:hypothetical protein
MAGLAGELVPKFRRETDAAAILVEGEGFEVSRGDSELGGWSLGDGIREGGESGEEQEKEAHEASALARAFGSVNSLMHKAFRAFK